MDISIIFRYYKILSVALFPLSFAEVSKYRNSPFYQSDSHYLFYFLLVLLSQDKTKKGSF